MKTILHKADTRGHANYGWLNSYHSFSFANYQNKERMNFGALRVLNDDTVSEGRGFDTHPHQNMEIISIPLEGDLQHQDDIGNSTIIKQGDIQIMSAGTGVNHSEYNKNRDKAVQFLQIWIIPNKANVTPRYDQISTIELQKENELYQVLSPNKNDTGIWTYQDAWLSLGDFTKDTTTSYALNKKGNGIYAFILEGNVKVESLQLNKRDGLGLWETDKITLNASKNSKVLLIEVPMAF